MDGDGSIATTSRTAQRERQCVASGTGANVEPRVVRHTKRQEDIEGLVVRPVWVKVEAVAHRRVEIGRIRFLAAAIDLLSIGHHAGAPRGQQFVRTRRQDVRHEGERSDRT